jgi:chromate transporter
VIFAGWPSLYGALIDMPLVQALFLGVKATVVVIVVEAISGSPGARSRPAHWILAALAFVALYVFAGALSPGVLWLRAFGGATAAPAQPLRRAAASSSRLLAIPGRRVVACWGARVVPAACPASAPHRPWACSSATGRRHLRGAYAVLTYMGQEVVSGYGWSRRAAHGRAWPCRDDAGAADPRDRLRGIVAGLNQAASGWGVLAG